MWHGIIRTSLSENVAISYDIVVCIQYTAYQLSRTYLLLLVNLYPYTTSILSLTPSPGNRHLTLCVYEFFVFFLDLTYESCHTVFVFLEGDSSCFVENGLHGCRVDVQGGGRCTNLEARRGEDGTWSGAVLVWAMRMAMSDGWGLSYVNQAETTGFAGGVDGVRGIKDDRNVCA